ncbi:MAG: patatin-like phospholipase family protein [Dehalococcoidales bacterium]|nr:patatin-like phospholipase family protein [Dehalococcoidales bacterium]
MSRKKVGIALGGGAARGLAHIGVLEILEKEHIPIDMIAGTSAGAIVGALFATGKSAAEIKKEVLEIDLMKRWQLIDIALPKTGFIGGKKLIELLKSYIGDVDFSDLKIPFACTSTDIMSGEEVIINKGSLLEGVRASISVPIAFSACEHKGRFLVDGGVVDQVPVDVVKNMGADIVIAVNVSPRMPNIGQRIYIDEAKLDADSVLKDPNIFTVIMKFINIINSQSTDNSLRKADVVIEPRLAGISFTDFKKADKCILEGEFAGIDALLDIKRLLAG